jgi:sugar phosphate isomerase/epimerase
MLTRRNFLWSVMGGLAASVGSMSRNLWAAGRLAWSGPIGLQLGWVCTAFAKDPVEAQKLLATPSGRQHIAFQEHPTEALNQIAAIGYKEVELAPNIGLNPPLADLRAAGLSAPSAYFRVPKTTDDWKRSIDVAKSLRVQYMVTGNDPKLDADGWNRFIDLLGECGTLSHAAGIQFCYHAHNHEYAPLGNSTPYDMMLTRLSPDVLKMEMDIYWAVYAGVDPVSYFQRYPGRFPLLHLKELRKGIPIGLPDGPSHQGVEPVVPVGQGRIDWARILAHKHTAGTKHIYVELNPFLKLPVFESAKISFDYVRNLRES